MIGYCGTTFFLFIIFVSPEVLIQIFICSTNPCNEIDYIIDAPVPHFVFKGLGISKVNMVDERPGK
jgi:hypothetical protein